MSPARTTTRKGAQGGSRSGARNNPAQSHRKWLTLVDREGPFLAVPPLARLYSTGIPAISSGAKEALRDAKPAFNRAWDAWRAADSTDSTDHLGHQGGPGGTRRAAGDALAAYREARDAWVGTILREVLGWGPYWRPAPEPALAAFTAASTNETVRVTPDGVLMVEDRVGALVYVVDPIDSLRDPSSDGWSLGPV